MTSARDALTAASKRAASGGLFGSITQPSGRTVAQKALAASIAQLEAKRIGADSKIVLTGDTSQIDAPFSSEQTNALTAVVSAFAGQACFGRIRLTRGDRSPVAELAARLM